MSEASARQQRVLPEIREALPEIIALRHDFHRHPGLGFDVGHSAGIVAERLRAWGCDEVTEGVGKSGVVAVIRGRLGQSDRAIGLRADMDALPLEEKTGVAWSSEVPGMMHACGHDGHTAWLLAVARYLALTRRFAGRAVLIFQPGEEGFAGAREMVQDGLFERWPVDEVYAAHGGTEIPLGTYGLSRGAMMAAADRFVIEVKGVGGHGARPQKAVDPVLIAAEAVVAMQSIASRSADPMHPVVVSIGSVHGGSEDGVSVIPDTVRLAGTTRCMSPGDRDMIERRMGEICEGLSRMHGARVELSYIRMYPALVNAEPQRLAMAGAAAEVAGRHCVDLDFPSSMGAEDFSFMLEQRPGAFLRVGMGDEDHKSFAHNPGFDFNDRCIGEAASILSRLVERRLAELNGGDAR